MHVTIVTFLVAVIGLFLYWSARKDKYTLLLQIQQGNGIIHVQVQLTLFLKFHIFHFQISFKNFIKCSNMNWGNTLMNQVK